MGLEVRKVVGVPVLRDFASQVGTPIVINDTTAIGYFLNNANVVTPLGSSGGGFAISDAITGGTANRVLYEDSSNKVAESTNLQFDGTDFYAKKYAFVGSTATGSGLVLRGNSNNDSGFIGPLSSHISAGTSLDLAIAATGASGQVRVYSGATPIGTFTNAGMLDLPVNGSTGSGFQHVDALWYRSAADTWRTPDSAVVDVDLTVSGQVKVPTAGTGAGVLLGSEFQLYYNSATTMSVLKADTSSGVHMGFQVAAGGWHLFTDNGTPSTTNYKAIIAGYVLGLNSGAGGTPKINFAETGSTYTSISGVPATQTLEFEDHVNVLKSSIFGTFLETTEQAGAPAAPAANGVRIYAIDNGAGKTQLMAIFNSGAAQQLAIEP